MKYEAVYLYTNSNQFIGVAIKKTNAQQLQSNQIWSDSAEEIEDFKKTLASLNDEHQLRQFWPEAMDPEVVELVEDDDWEPLELHEEKVPDWNRSTIVMLKQPVFGFEFDGSAGAKDEFGVPEGAVVPAKNPATGEVEWRDTDDIDHANSNIVYETRLVPDPQEAQNRYFKAQELVARRRLASAQNV